MSFHAFCFKIKKSQQAKQIDKTKTTTKTKTKTYHTTKTKTKTFLLGFECDSDFFRFWSSCYAQKLFFFDLLNLLQITPTSDKTITKTKTETKTSFPIRPRQRPFKMDFRETAIFFPFWHNWFPRKFPS